MEYMLFQFYNIAMNDSPNGVVVNLEIFVDEKVSHVGNRPPFDFRMSRFKVSREHVGCFANDFDILYDAIIAKHICFQFLS